MTVRHDHWIGGKAAEPASGRYLGTLDPRTRRSGAEIAAGNADDVESAVAAAGGGAAGVGRDGPPSSAPMSCTAWPMPSTLRRDELIELEQASTGKVTAQARSEVDTAAAYFRYYAGIVRAHGGRTIDQGSRFHTYTRYEPYGVVGIITPWNFPMNQACRGVAPALAAGNAVVLKPSEITSLSSLHLARVATEAGLPDGLLNVVTGTGPDVGTPLVTHPDVARVAFTGSVATGRHLAGLAAERLIPATLELGGKSPVVVFADADLDRAVAACVTAVSMNAGQVCTATTRLLAEASVHDEMVRRIVEGVERLEPGVDFGPMITEPQYDKVLEHFAEAEAAGLTPAVGGSVYADGPGSEGLYIRPTVYAGVSPDAAHRTRGDLRAGAGDHALRRRRRRPGSRQRHRVRPAGQRVER